MSAEVTKSPLWEHIRTTSKSVETGMDALERKRTGSYYTALELTDAMMIELVEHLKASGKNLCELTFLEPCVGSGNFVFSYLKAVANEGFSQDQFRGLLNNIYVADINPVALDSYQLLLTNLVKELYDIVLDESYFTEHVGRGLLFDVAEEIPHYIPLQEVFSQSVLRRGFDIVATNPPYKNLKAERGHYSSVADYDADKNKYNQIAKIAKKQFRYSANGVLNLYKIFVEEILDQYATKDGVVSLLIPASIMSDKTCERLRTHILQDMGLLSVKVIREGSGYIDAQQALCTVLIDKGSKTKTIRVVKDYHKNPLEVAFVLKSDIMDKNNGNAIVAVNKAEYEVLRKLKKFPAVKDLDFIINLRGELDLTANKEHIVSEDTGYRFLRGRNIGLYELLDTGEHESASVEFVESSTKTKYIHMPRIICQQIANMHKEKRVTFAYVDKGVVLGNSCNFIAVDENQYGIDIFSLLGLFNSRVINWFFKLTSSNNHVNNYEIDCFPVPVESKEIPVISSLVKEYLSAKTPAIADEIERSVLRAYGLSADSNSDEIRSTVLNDLWSDLKKILPSVSREKAEELLHISGKISVSVLPEIIELTKVNSLAVQGIVTKYRKILEGVILNHTDFKLSDLDLEMIKSVPPGGSWKDIPKETVEKSKRLKRITETGGRTTLYGRIDYEKPSYTITTYFNRPGNGTYVHPAHERVISVREAARFQTFLDSYYFYGNKTQLLKQVGNAVPTILAYQIGDMIRQKTGCTKSIDLFCGAGGMTAGFKASGIQSLLCNDIEESACVTLKINNPEIPVLCGDITRPETKDLIAEVAKAGHADIICGGPPCQGFSMAGFRAKDDPRNQLFREFVDIVQRVDPKVIVFENVEGLLSYQGGQTYREVHALFSELGYDTEGRTLMTSDYAVPQRRKRVIIICTRKDMQVDLDTLFPESLTVDIDDQVTARETIYDLENVPCDENAKYGDSSYNSNILKLFKGKISYSEYLSLYKKSNPSDEDVEDAPIYEQLSLLGFE